MKTSAVSADDLSRSVIAVPPVARYGDFSLNPNANRALIRHCEAGGVSTLMYGDNANLYNVGLYEYAAILDFLEQTAAPETCDSSMVLSGIGERPALVHMRDFRLAGFTSGAVCIGPRGSTRMLAALKAQQWDAAEKQRAAYLPLENLRDEHSPIRTLHDAVTLSSIADMGPIMPQLSNLDVSQAAQVKPIAQTLLAHDRALP